MLRCVVVGVLSADFSLCRAASCSSLRTQLLCEFSVVRRHNLELEMPLRFGIKAIGNVWAVVRRAGRECWPVPVAQNVVVRRDGSFLKGGSMDLVVHFMQYGKTACLKPGIPGRDWEENHRWSSDWEDVTCQHCLAGKELIATFQISDDGKSITCLRCKMISHHPEDVAHHYCSNCKVFHDDLWPPARKWWMEHPEPKPTWH